MNENGRKLIEMCSEKRLSAGNAFFEKKDINKFPGLHRGAGRGKK